MRLGPVIFTSVYRGEGPWVLGTSLAMMPVSLMAHVRGEKLLVLDQEFLQMIAADFFLPFDDELEVDRLVPCLHHGLEGLDVHEHLSFVVARSTGKNGALRVQLGLANDRLECRRSPQVERVRGLNIVVAVNEHGGQGRVYDALSIHHRIEDDVRSAEFVVTDSTTLVRALTLEAPIDGCACD